MFREIGRIAEWLSRDPLREGSDATLYSYVWNDPVGLTDPFGLAGGGRGNRATPNPNAPDVAAQDQALVNSILHGDTPATDFDNTLFGQLRASPISNFS